MVNNIFPNRNRTTLMNGESLVPSHLDKKPWLMGETSLTLTPKADTVNRWLLPYADFLTVLFCITLLWCGLALKQAHWLQIQNGKLAQALEQASQQLVVANQALEYQTTLVETLQKPSFIISQPTASVRVKLQPQGVVLGKVVVAVPQTSRVKQQQLPSIGQKAFALTRLSNGSSSTVR